MKYTKNLRLRKPDRTDRFNIEDFNANADIIDGIPEMVNSSSYASKAYISSYGKTGIAGIAETEETE